LRQWFFYGDHGSGFAVTFDFSQYLGRFRILQAVRYTREEQYALFKRVCSPFCGYQEFSLCSWAYVPFFKESVWADEKEWRVVFPATGGTEKVDENLVPYVDCRILDLPLLSPIKQIRIGPKRDFVRSEKALEILLKQCYDSHSTPDIKRSEVKLR